MTPPPIPSELNRASQINALRDLVAFLDARPEIPIPFEVTSYLHGGATADREMALCVRRMGAPLRVAPDGTTSAVKQFGPVRLRVVRTRPDAAPKPAAARRGASRALSLPVTDIFGGGL